MGSCKYYYTDALGSIRSVVNSSGTVLEAHDFYPLGLVMPGHSYGSGTKEKFTGQEHDSETGLDYFGARYYMPAYGRFASVDPLADELAGWSPYSYTLDNPLVYVDSDGQWPGPILFNPKVAMSAYRAAVAGLREFASGLAGGASDLGTGDTFRGQVITMEQEAQAANEAAYGRAAPYVGAATTLGAILVGSSKQILKKTDEVVEGVGKEAARLSIKPTRHSIQQKMNRGVTSADELGAVKSPLKVGDVKLDSRGRPSQKLIGENATVTVNPDNGNITTVYPTGSRTANKLKREQENQ